MKRRWDYLDQAFANRLALMLSSEYSERKEALRTLCKAFGRAHIRWALNCSANLFLRGFVDDFDDIDVLLYIDDAEKACSSLEQAGGKLVDTVQKPYFTSGFYQEAYIGKVHLDLVGDFTVATFGTEYMYPVSEKEIDFVSLDQDIQVPLCPVEANLILYGMMEGWQAKRRFKRQLCFDYLLSQGIEYPEVLERALKDYSLPFFLKEVVLALLKKSEDEAE